MVFEREANIINSNMLLAFAICPSMSQVFCVYTSIPILQGLYYLQYIDTKKQAVTLPQVSQLKRFFFSFLKLLFLHSYQCFFFPLYSLSVSHNTISLNFGQLNLSQIVVKKWEKWVSLVVQWIRVCLPMQGTRIVSLVWGDYTCLGAIRHKQPLSPCAQSLCSTEEACRDSLCAETEQPALTETGDSPHEAKKTQCDQK